MKIFTITEAAKICKVAPRTISRWFDSGMLKGYRIPGTAEIRVPREFLIEFMKRRGMLLGEEQQENDHGGS